MIALMISGRLVSRMDQRVMLAGGCTLASVALFFMTRVTPTIDFWNLAWPRFLQGFSQGFIFVPLQALTLATIPTERLGNSTAAYNVARNIGGSMGVALVTTLLARRSQLHQATLTSHVDQWSFETAARLRMWTDHFANHGADTFTAGRQAMAMLYRETVTQAHILAYADDFWLLLVVYSSVLLLIPFMRRVRSGRGARARGSADGSESGARDPGLPAPAE
jgi:DHA2 family multidrug resistance protein